jgi:hypothetical protein
VYALVLLGSCSSNTVCMVAGMSVTLFSSESLVLHDLAHIKAKGPKLFQKWQHSIKHLEIVGVPLHKVLDSIIQKVKQALGAPPTPPPQNLCFPGSKFVRCFYVLPRPLGEAL